MEKVDLKQYTAAVIACIHLARQSTSGGRVAAQALLSAFNGDAYQLDVASLCDLDHKNYKTVMAVIHGRYDTRYEPHYLIADGSRIFRDLWKQWEHLHVEERGKRECPVCDGRGKVLVNPDDWDDERTEVCYRCQGRGRICGCAL